MKHHVFLFLYIVTTLTVSCQEFQDNATYFSNREHDSYSVSEADILTYLQAEKNLSNTKTDNVSISPVIYNQDTLLYVINFEDGWEIITADKRAPRTVSFCEKGHITWEEIMSNSEEKAFYERLINELSDLKGTHDYNNENIESDWQNLSILSEHESWVLISTTILDETIQTQDHLLETRWGQGPKWNCRAPKISPYDTTRCLTGCVPVAAAQMLYYLHDKIGLPEKAYGDCVNNKYIATGDSTIVLHNGDVTFPGVTYFSYIWDLMPLKASDSSSYFCSVSTLMVQLGILLSAEYSVDNTSADTMDIYDVFRNSLNINCDRTNTFYPTNVVFSIIDDKMPCILKIAYYTGDNNEQRHGHAVIADAGRSISRRVRRTYVWNSMSGPRYKTVESNELLLYIGINWGWEDTGIYDSGTTNTKWYNTAIISWQANSSNNTYTHEEGVIYGFRTF